MPYRIDPEIRRAGEAGQALLASLLPPRPDVRMTDYCATTADRACLRLRWYTKGGDRPGSGVVYAHGGGMVLGNLDAYDSLISAYVAETGVPFLSVSYRLAPEVHGDVLATDTFTALGWLAGQAGDMGVDPGRIALMGDSGGGGVAAGAAIIARDRGHPLAMQILVYPMLDDRTVTPDPALAPFATWSYDQNFTAWQAVLGGGHRDGSVAPAAAPARLTDFRNLAPAYIDVGDLDIFCDEDISYAQRLSAAGVPIELHVHPGAPHGFDRLAPGSALTRRAMADRVRVLRSL